MSHMTPLGQRKEKMACDKERFNASPHRSKTGSDSNEINNSLKVYEKIQFTSLWNQEDFSAIAGDLSSPPTVIDNIMAQQPVVYKLLPNYTCPCTDAFVPRKRETAAINAKLARNNLFLQGDEGSGRTTLVHMYLSEYFHEYDHIIYLKYKGSLADLFINDALVTIENFSQEYIFMKSQHHTKKSLLENKIYILRSLVSSKTLFVIDDYNTVDENESLIFSLSARFLMITSRRLEFCDYELAEIESLPFEEIKKIFLSRCTPSSHHDDKKLSVLFDLADQNLLAITLLAKQMAMRNISLDRMIATVQARGIREGLSGTFRASYNTNRRKGFEFISILFESYLSYLVSSEYYPCYRYLLGLLCLISPFRMRISDFMACSREDDKIYDIIDDLYQMGWIKRENNYVSSKVLVKEVVMDRESVKIDSYLEFINLYSDVSNWDAALIKYAEKEEKANIIKKLIDQFDEINESNYIAFKNAEKILTTAYYTNDSMRLLEMMENHVRRSTQYNEVDLAYVLFRKAWIYGAVLDNRPMAKKYYQASADELDKCAEEAHSREYYNLVFNIYSDRGLLHSRWWDIPTESDLEYALECVELALSVLDKVFEDEKTRKHKESWLRVFEAECCANAGKLERGMEYVVMAKNLFDSFKSNSEQDEMYYSNIQYRYSQILFRKGKYEEALQVVLEANEIYEKYFPTCSLRHCDHLLYIASLYLRTGNKETAEQIAADVKKNYKKVNIKAEKIDRLIQVLDNELNVADECCVNQQKTPL